MLKESIGLHTNRSDFAIKMNVVNGKSETDIKKFGGREFRRGAATRFP